MGKLAKVDASNVWRGHLRVKGNSPVPSDHEYDMWKSCDTGLSISDVAEVYDVTEGTVRAAIRKTENFFISTCTVDVGLLKIRQHARLEALIEASLTDYQESGGTVKTVNRKMIPGQNGEESLCIEETITEKQMTRDPRFINVAMKAMSDQRDLWPGANAPKSSSITNANGDGDPKINVEHLVKSMTPDQIEALKKLEEMYEEQDVIDV
jgi:hypothetical protein